MTYKNPPITEAVIDIRVIAPPNMEVDELKKVQPKGYLPAGNKVEYSSSIEVKSKGQAAVIERHLGFILADESRTQLMQARIDGFTFSKLAPYSDWETFKDEARNLWNVYVNIAKPVKITRIAVRYINRIDFPEPVGELSNYLKTRPEISDEIIHGIESFFIQVQIPQPDIDAMLILHESRALPPKEKQNVLSVFLDIDLFKTNSLTLEDKELWASFEVLRNRKNKIFEASITDLTRRLFD